MMTYFANGREVDRDLSKFSNVIPVHIKCIDWYVSLDLTVHQCICFGH